jgi:putative transposase
MPRHPRVAPGGLVYHVLNRAVGKIHLFRNDRDFDAFLRVMIEAQKRFPIRLLAWCILSNHWHFVPYPRKDGELSEFFRWLTHTHVMRWRVAHRTVGYGPLYQGRFKSFPVQTDESLLTVCRYVERNALSAGLVRRAEDWRYGSLWARLHGGEELRSLLSPWPVERPDDWVQTVNRPMSAREIERIKTSIVRNRPFGSEAWITKTAQRLDLKHTLGNEGRPRKQRGVGRERGDKN